MNVNNGNGQSSIGMVPVSRRLQDAADTGLISDASLQALEVIDMGALIQAGLGVARNILSDRLGREVRVEAESGGYVESVPFAALSAVRST